jgi:hypothetical protein
LLPNTDLAGIAMEGLVPEDQSVASNETVEIADLTFYHGKRATFKDADKVRITQFKYSISKKSMEFRAADARKTVEKFGIAYRSLKRKQGAALVRANIYFELHTNRPVYGPLAEAITALAAKNAITGAYSTEACHPFHVKAATQTGAKLPPVGA